MVRYKQTALGILWAIIQPVFTMLVFTIFFGKLGGFEEKSKAPYQVATFCALLPWQLFANALTNAGNSLVTNSNLITKVYFPRLVIPISSVLAGCVDFAVSFVILIGLMMWYGVTPHWGIVFLPAFVAFALLAALSVGLWLSALNVTYRDVRYTIPFLTQFWMFATPIAYPIGIIPERYQALYALNPMVGVVEGFRWAMLGTDNAPGPMIAVSAAITLLLFVGGLFYFRRTEKFFADRI